ncbi:helix-turn-helix domain-containing protein [Roseateles cellulosilyticus]|uniref:Helix-turn-helix domain-containing protein n=1 Tax=Pelomonas cellulosilytica TaxID=2906762 RepID=A0ABS8XVT8_9BURK|nr:helix-turn-helix transcriptional regulator [Pelomonas sp. P8]MCE4554833.1 helix-turn-helix domain-containing protein [Pelomonas sp. P8]
MKDGFTLPTDLGAALQRARTEAGLSVTDVAKRAGRVRDVVYRLEKGEEVSLSSLFAVLSVLGLRLSLNHARMPTLDEVRARFSLDSDEDN